MNQLFLGKKTEQAAHSAESSDCGVVALATVTTDSQVVDFVKPGPGAQHNYTG